MQTVEDRIAKLEIRNSLLQQVTYLVLCVVIAAYSLSSFVEIIREYVAIRYSYRDEALFVVGQVGFQWLFMRYSSWAERKRYMFIALTISMIGAVLLWPLLICYRVLPLPVVGAISYFVLVVCVIFVMHHRLIIANSLPRILTGTWILYRLLLLLFIVSPR